MTCCRSWHCPRVIALRHNSHSPMFFFLPFITINTYIHRWKTYSVLPFRLWMNICSFSAMVFTWSLSPGHQSIGWLDNVSKAKSKRHWNWQKKCSWLMAAHQLTLYQLLRYINILHVTIEINLLFMTKRLIVHEMRLLRLSCKWYHKAKLWGWFLLEQSP